ncbi:exodeoxyribonuclease III [Desulfogranum japonicum]|uniref:exodeoxyribonuclease III n=1 Tax=Desulfogranum japonicum TaxID=231447 RepID=UPI00040CB030|nr:exodeoxyribonuclease III [Desulfogranum japonicum]
MASIDIETILPILKEEVAQYQVPVVDLIATQSQDPFKILVATILSARTKDEVTAAAVRRLFQEIHGPDDLARIGKEQLEKIIYPVGFFRNKAKYLEQLPEALNRKFQGQVPATMKDLLSLPGVGRKTANLVLAVAFGKPAICVDTHVHRIMNIWGYVETETPLQTEMVLREKLPQKYWIEINSILVAFGQGTCTPQRPHCDQCVIATHCPQIGVIPRTIKPEKNTDGRVFVSWNVNGLRAALKNGFIDVFASFNADIFALQEIKALPEQLPAEIVDMPGYHVYINSAKRKGYSGTAIFSKKEPVDVYYGLGEEAFDEEGRVLTLEYDTFFFVNAYFPNAQPGLKRLSFKEAFNSAMLKYLQKLEEKKTVILCGDLNVAHKPIDLANPKRNEQNPGFSPEERAWMDKYVEAGLEDTFRMFSTEAERYTWWSYRFNAREKNIGWRIDYFLIDKASRDRIAEASIHEHVMGSDHCPVSIRFQ